MIKMQITPLRPVETLRAQEVEPLLLANNSHAKLGLVRGAVIPTCEFMWSVLVFVRFGFILGQTGLLATIGLTAFCALVAFLTASSIAAIATNGVHRIMEGGIYRILEQSLGHGFGGSIALLYFIGLMLLTGIEIVGSVQSVFKTTASSITLTHSHYWDQVLVSVGTLILCVGVTLTGRKTVHILAFAFLIVLGLSFLSLIVGLATAVRFNHPLSIGTLRSNLYPPRTELHPIPDFAELITLLMPCFVGLYSGVNNARQLKNPNKSIPRGMFVAIGVSLALYVALFLLFAASIDRKTLLEDTLVGVKMGWPVWWLLVPAIYLVGFGASLQLLLVASAVLHSLSAELFQWTHHIYMHHQIKDEPKPATLLTAALILPLLFIPELEELATLTTMCFLMCYGTTNLACALLSTFNSPEWRPKYSIVSTQHLYLVSFSGFLLCLGVMLQISWHATVGAIMLVCLVAYSVQTSSGTWSWGSGLNGLIFYLTLRHLLASEQEMFRFQLNRYWNASADVEDQAESSTQRQGRTGEKIIWRPQIVAFLEPLDRQSHTAYRLLAFISQMKARNRSLSVFVRVITLESEKLRFKQMISDQHHSRSPSSLSRPIPIPSIDQLTNDHRVRSYQDLARSDRKKLRDRLLLEQKLILQQAMNDQIVEGFAKVIIAPTVLVGQRIFLQSMGLGELTPNMVIVNWPERLELEARDTEPKPDGDVRGHEMSEEADARALLEMQALWSMTRRMGLSMAICKGIGGFPSNDELAYGTIDVWWVVEDGQLLLLIAYLLKQSEGNKYALWPLLIDFII